MHDGSPGDARRGTTRGVVAAALALAVLIALVYGRTLGAEFTWVFDDPRFVVNNPHVTHPQSWTAFFTDAATIDPNSPRGMVRPLRTLEFALDARLFGLSPAAFHLHSLAWFAAGAALLLVVLRDLCGDLRAAFVGAAVWVVHPMQTEAVAWISSRGDVAAGALLLACVAAALRPGRTWTAVSVACALLAMGYKESGVVAPLLVVIARRSRPGGPSLVREALRAWPWAVAATLYLAYRGHVQWGETRHIDTYVLGGSAAGTVSTMFRGFGAYAAFALLPVRPAVDWFLDPSTTLADPASLAWLAVHATVLAWGFLRTSARPVAGGAALWFYAALIPVANWPFYLGIPTTERFLHVSLAGLGLAVAGVYAAARARSPSADAAAFVVCGALAVSAWVRIGDWRSDETLWPATARTVESPRAEGYLASELRKEGFALRAAQSPQADRTLEEGLAHAHRAVALWARIEGRWHSTTHAVLEPHVNAANLCYLLGRPGEALFHADEAIRIGEDLFPQSHYNRALALLDLGRGAAARAAILRATEVGLTPDEEVREILLRAAAHCEADGELEIARRALAEAVRIPGRGAARAQAAIAAFDRRAAAVEERIRIAAAGASGDLSRFTVAMAIQLASLGDVEAADATVARVPAPSQLPPHVAPGHDPAATDWVRARWMARGTREGWERAADLLAGSSDPDAVFVRARALEELGRDDEARAAFLEFVGRFPGAPPAEDRRGARARAAIARLERPCPEFGAPGAPR